MFAIKIISFIILFIYLCLEAETLQMSEYIVVRPPSSVIC